MSTASTQDLEKTSTLAKAAKLFQKDSRSIILFDGVCNMCNGWVNVVLDWDPQGKFRFASLQSEVGKTLLQRSGRAPDDLSSFVLAEKDQSYFKSDAALRVASNLPRGLPGLTVAAAAASALVPGFVRDGAYDIVAANRYRFMGKRDVCRVGDDRARFEDRFVPDSALLE